MKRARHHALDLWGRDADALLRLPLDLLALCAVVAETVSRVKLVGVIPLGIVGDLRAYHREGDVPKTPGEVAVGLACGRDALHAALHRSAIDAELLRQCADGPKARTRCTRVTLMKNPTEPSSDGAYSDSCVTFTLYIGARRNAHPAHSSRIAAAHE